MLTTFSTGLTTLGRRHNYDVATTFFKIQYLTNFPPCLQSWARLSLSLSLFLQAHTLSRTLSPSLNDLFFSKLHLVLRSRLFLSPSPPAFFVASDEILHNFLKQQRNKSIEIYLSWNSPSTKQKKEFQLKHINRWFQLKATLKDPKIQYTSPRATGYNKL